MKHLFNLNRLLSLLFLLSIPAMAKVLIVVDDIYYYHDADSKNRVDRYVQEVIQYDYNNDERVKLKLFPDDLTE